MATTQRSNLFCDGITRRQAIRAGVMGLAGLSLADVLRLRAETIAQNSTLKNDSKTPAASSNAVASGTTPPNTAPPNTAPPNTAPPDTAVIYVALEGGPSQFETYDPKPNAPSEVRGPFTAIETSVPGVRFCETLPRQARAMRHMTILRSIHHPSTQHSSSVHLIKTGYYCRAEAVENEMPSLGSYTAKIRSAKANGESATGTSTSGTSSTGTSSTGTSSTGTPTSGMPPYVTLNRGARYSQGHFLGAGYNPFEVKSDPNAKDFSVPNLTLVDGLSVDRLGDRRRLLAEFDRARRIHDVRGAAASCDQFTRQAFDIVTGSAARRAFDLAAEKPTTRDRYGRTDLGQSLLLARRLVEHGVSFVTVGTFGWDHHGGLVEEMKRDVPSFDAGLAALVEDLVDRGLDKRVLVVALGEFGRAPRITSINGLTPGRDHWGDVSSVLMAGGGLRGGQVIGASDAHGAVPASSPYRLECVLAAMYRHLGIDPALTFPDHNGRPRALLEIRDRIVELG